MTPEQFDFLWENAINQKRFVATVPNLSMVCGYYRHRDDAASDMRLAVVGCFEAFGQKQYRQAALEARFLGLHSGRMVVYAPLCTYFDLTTKFTKLEHLPRDLWRP